MRRRLQRLVERIRGEIGEFGHRVFTDSAPVLEVALAAKAGLGWRGKHTLLLTRDQGSWFFLGEIYTDLPLPPTPPQSAHCGSCRACIDACPTGAIVAPYELDARRCISYLTIELAGSIPEALRPLIGNRIYGCDDCQLACPWNRFAQIAAEPGLRRPPRPRRRGPGGAVRLDRAAEFDRRMEGSAIRRIGFERWSRNIAVALGNAPPRRRRSSRRCGRARDDPSPLVREHVAWALRAAGRRRQTLSDASGDQRLATVGVSGSAGSSTRSAASPPAPAPARSRPSRRSAPAAAAPRTR